MACLKESWLQEVLESLRLPAFSPALCKALLPVIEMHLKKLVEQAHKFQRRSKSPKLSGSIVFVREVPFDVEFNSARY